MASVGPFESGAWLGVPGVFSHPYSTVLLKVSVGGDKPVKHARESSIIDMSVENAELRIPLLGRVDG